MARSDFGEMVGERVQDLIGGLGPGERPGLSFQVAIQSLMSFSRACTKGVRAAADQLVGQQAEPALD